MKVKTLMQMHLIFNNLSRVGRVRSLSSDFPQCQLTKETPRETKPRHTTRNKAHFSQGKSQPVVQGLSKSFLWEETQVIKRYSTL